MKAPLYNKLIAYSNSKMPFHMPGHKFGQGAGISNLDLTALDNTEALGLDNLYEAEGIIKEAMDLMTDFYGSQSSIFLTNGSTTGIITSILATCNEGESLIVARNAHHSVWNGLILAGIKPIYISPEYMAEEDLLGELNVETVKEAFKKYPEAKGLLMVSPTYEGVVSDIAAISEVVHQYNKVLIVDEAHGAHFVLGNPFPTSSIQLGADLVIHSMHKTLPTLTQSALLHIGSHRVSYDKVINCLRMIQTSSPSYLMMGLMDYIRAYMIEHRGDIKLTYSDELIRIRTELKELKLLKLITLEDQPYDISKIIISTRYSQIDGYELARLLDMRYDITVEAALSSYVIMMTTMADQTTSLNYLLKALQEIDELLINQREYALTKNRVNHFLGNKLAEGISPRKVYYSEKKWIELKQCKGRRLANNIMLYPPGIPIICMGEIVEERHIVMISEFKDRLQGIRLKNGQVDLEVI